MNIYIQQIQNLSIQNKYLKWYVNIVERALQRASSRRQAKKLLGYCEKHHIVPESFFIERTRKGPKGFLPGDSEHQDNLVYLTPKEHIYCHIFLIKMMDSKLSLMKVNAALDRLLKGCDGVYELNPKTYAIIKKEYSKNNPFTLEEIKGRAKQTKKLKYDDENYNNRTKAKKTKLLIYGDENYNNRGEAKKTALERYGIENYNNRDKAKETCLEIYGFEYSSQNENVKSKVKTTKLETYDDENYNNRDKAKETWLEVYGVDNPNKLPKIRQKTLKTIEERYGIGITNVSQTLEVKEKVTKTWAEKAYISCPHCDKKSKSMSTMTQWHFDNCKHNPNKVQEIFKCPYCEVTSTSLRILKIRHFDDCKNKTS